MIGGLLTGCVSTPHPNHHHEGKVPPRLAVVWTRADSFGPVPPEQRERGNAVCGDLNTTDLKFEPTGYHSKAEKPGGFPYEHGGFYCEAVRPKKKG